MDGNFLSRITLCLFFFGFHPGEANGSSKPIREAIQESFQDISTGKTGYQVSRISGTAVYKADDTIRFSIASKGKTGRATSAQISHDSLAFQVTYTSMSCTSDILLFSSAGDTLVATQLHFGACRKMIKVNALYGSVTGMDNPNAVLVVKAATLLMDNCEQSESVVYSKDFSNGTRSTGREAIAKSRMLSIESQGRYFGKNPVPFSNEFRFGESISKLSTGGRMDSAWQSHGSFRIKAYAGNRVLGQSFCPIVPTENGLAVLLDRTADGDGESTEMRGEFEKGKLRGGRWDILLAKNHCPPFEADSVSSIPIR